MGDEVTDQCLTTEDRAAYTMGQMPSGRFREAVRHLAGCGRCRKAAMRSMEMLEWLAGQPAEATGEDAMGDEVTREDVTVRIETTLRLESNSPAAITRPDRLKFLAVALPADPDERRATIERAVAEYVMEEVVEFSWEECER